MPVNRALRCDLHIHSCLSPCSHLLMTPGNIIKQAKVRGLDVIAITDHNRAGNVPPALALAERSGLIIIPGLEVETREEVHLLSLFPDLDSLLRWEQVVLEHLPFRENNEELVGYQLLTDLNDEYIAKEGRLLAQATTLSLEEAVGTISELGGIAIPSHVDRRVNSILSQLGLIPAGLGLEFIEISKNTDPEHFFRLHPYLTGFSHIRSSDAHQLSDLGQCGLEQAGFPFPEQLFWLLEGKL